MAKIAGVLFDKDGTLFDFCGFWGGWCENVLEEACAGNKILIRRLALAAGYDVDAGEFIVGSSIVNATADETNQLWADLLPDWTAAQLAEVGLRQLASLKPVPVSDLSEVLGALKAHGLKLGIATNDFESGAHTQLAQSGIEKYFDFVCGFDSGFGSKPAAGMIKGFCDRVGLPAGAVAMVGDSTHDLIAGRAAGAGLRVGVLTGPAQKSDLEADADIILPDISHLCGYMDKQGLL